MAARTANTYLKILLGALFVAIVVVYTVRQSENFAKGPSITIVSPEGGTIFEESLIVIEGRVERVSEITLNDQPIFVDEQGNFNEPLLLAIGSNAITLKATDAFGREAVETLELVFNQ